MKGSKIKKTKNYHGPDYAYRAAALSTRVGPIAAEFTEKVLTTLYPEYDAPGLVVIELGSFNFAQFESSGFILAGIGSASFGGGFGLRPGTVVVRR